MHLSDIKYYLYKMNLLLHHSITASSLFLLLIVLFLYPRNPNFYLLLISFLFLLSANFLAISLHRCCFYQYDKNRISMVTVCVLGGIIYLVRRFLVAKIQTLKGDESRKDVNVIMKERD